MRPKIAFMNDKKSLLRQPKVAIVHDYFNQYGGGERVAEALAEIWPEANVYTSLYDAKLMKGWLKIDPKRIKTNFISKLPFANYLSKHYFFLYPLAFRLQNLGKPDVIISSSSYAAKFVNKPKGAVHICYLHTVPRFLWGYDTELSRYYRHGFDRYFEFFYKTLVPLIKFFLRRWDYKVAQNIDYFIVNSKEVQTRLKKHYKRDGVVIYPPVDIERFQTKLNFKQTAKSLGNYYLVVSRLGGYKKIDIVVDAFNKIGEKLIIVGEGPQFGKLKKTASSNIELLGRVDDEKVKNLLLGCKALIFPTLEDFGIVPVEAMAAGKPVIAYSAGGALETVVGGKTGIFFDEQTPQAIIEAVKTFEKSVIDPNNCIVQAKKFSKKEFKRKIKEFVDLAIKNVKRTS